MNNKRCWEKPIRWVINHPPTHLRLLAHHADREFPAIDSAVLDNVFLAHGAHEALGIDATCGVVVGFKFKNRWALITL